LDELNNYDQVIWFTGNDGGGSAGPDAAGESALGDWLDGEGCLMISSQDYFSDRGMTTLITGYLGVGAASPNVANSIVTGQGSVFGGLGPYNLSYPFENRSDLISPNSNSELAFSGDRGNAAVNKDGGEYRTTFMSFPWEVLPTVIDRQVTLASFLSWCDPGTAPSIAVLPSAISSTMLPNATSEEVLNIGNNGDGFLIWQVTEDLNRDCSSAEDISWITISSEDGTTISGSTTPVTITFNSEGMAAGAYTGALCVDSNDSLSPVVEVQIEMNVFQLAVYLPAITN
jgi:hypothetical protein